MVTDHIFPRFRVYCRDYISRTELMPEFVAKEYAKAILKAGLTDDQIKGGLRVFEKGAGEKPFMPNPTEFVEMCQESTGALPGYREAYQEACRYAGDLCNAKWTHPAIYVAGKAVGWFELRNRPEKETWPTYKQAYKDALARVSAGEVLEAYVPKQRIAHTNVFEKDLNTPGRLKALRLVGLLKQ